MYYYYNINVILTYYKRYDNIAKMYYTHNDIIQFHGIVIPTIPYDKKRIKKEPHRPHWIVWF